MDTRAIIIISCWIAVTVISSVYIWVGGIDIWVNISVGLLVFTAFIITFGVGLGFKPERKPEITLQNELRDIKTKLEILMKEIEEIKKVIEE
ncbi:MAG: hypothetical protein AYL32_012780 [Candidatus Bathyarchaeota archaeon B26-2]|nr:MAG: hypothetical protein AYL32_012780 [Candidatus Bathyarchaeota archaeon B26-2]